jgi:cell wall-associated NlpC family hydrolase
MSTLGWVFILMAAIIVRAVAKGRALDLPQDVSDAFLAIVRGDFDSLSESLNRSGDTATVSAGLIAGEGVASALGSDAAGRLTSAQKAANTNIAYWAYKLGEAARGYRFGAAGPTYYDCSGLMYRAVQKVGYDGPRFWTGSVSAMPGMHKIAGPDLGVSQVTSGDLVVWPGHHMGVVVGQNRMYSARNPKAGISESAIKGFRKENPIYLRFTPKG